MRYIKTCIAVFAFLSMSACSADDTRWRAVLPGSLGMNAQELERARDYALQGGGSGYIIRSGKVVMKWGDELHRYDLKSTTKSIGISALGLALQDKRVGLDDLLTVKLQELKTHTQVSGNQRWLDKISLRQIAEQTAGFDKPGGYCDLFFEPGTAWAYSDCGPNWLADYLTLLFGEDLNEILYQRVFQKIGITKDDLTWRNNAYREVDLRGIPRREMGSGIHANIRAMALIGELYLNGGMWNGESILPIEFIELVSRPNPDNTGLKVLATDKGIHYKRAPMHYGLLWWNNNDGSLPEVPRDAFWSWGLHDSFIFVIPSLDIVAVRAGKSWPRLDDQKHYDHINGFLSPIVKAVNKGAPYPNSTLITGIKWDDDIFHAGEGSDNWPITWGETGALFTAYGDGWGFAPKNQGPKLSLGIATIEGTSNDIRTRNIRSPSAEQFGHGETGKKASGLLMVDNVLYMWVRNANNNGQHCQLAWSIDRGQTWEWSLWKHKGLGYCTFLNYGKNYAGARDEYIYTYSPNTDSAYVPSDNVILTRVHKSNIKQLIEYEYFAGLDQSGKPKWSPSFNDRQSIFTFKEGCNRLDVVYNKGLGRYMMTLRNVGQTAWEPGGPDHWSLYESVDPWGPWATVFYTEKWDIDPGEALRIPSKWITPDGTEFHLVFSGNDSFSVRKAKLSLR